MLNTLAKSNNIKNLPTAKYGGWLEKYQGGGIKIQQDNTYNNIQKLF